ncbi:hypothetical protein EDC56_2748 [Sinobacterium caligoides]|uniref:Dolichyl-phosphate-mannose-protein mannosyltransferase n=1 Tax=Sinobacterium caligoides TaxID=933926 RepID=A0A3N2DKA8_9GAMM|nr:hypothetical protein [Sinobacterium caligoides]ROS00112.1 hypothetical protein EDC56_2748 [Sinobacterium caligoides]
METVNAEPAAREGEPLILRNQLLLLFCLALLVRLAFYEAFPHIIRGDAITYSQGSYNFAHGLPFDDFWYSLFYWWQWPFQLVFVDKEQASVFSTLVAGSVLVVLAVYITDRIFSSWRVNVLSGLLLITHPRLIEYSLNGYAEMFFCLCFVIGLLGAIVLLTDLRRRWALLWGLGFGLYFCVRQESITAYFLSLGVFLLGYYFSGARRPLCKVLSLIIYSLFGGVVVIVIYASVSQLNYDTLGLLQKSDVPALTNLPSEYLQALGVLLHRFVINIALCLLYFPIYFILSPSLLWVFYCLYVRDRNLFSLSNLMLSVMLFWPFLFFCLIIPPQDNYEFRYYIAALVPLLIYGALGLVLAWDSFAVKKVWRSFLIAFVVVSLLLHLGVAIYQAERLTRRNDIHFTVARWLDQHVPVSETIVGSRSGYIANTVYFSAQPQFYYRPKSDDLDVLLEYMRSNNHRWLVIYEQYLADSEPALLTVLQQGIPGMKQLEEFIDPYSKQRVQVFYLASEDARR